MNGSAAMQCIEIRNSLFVETDHLGIYNSTAFEARGILHNAGIAFGPIGPVHGVEPHTGIADVDLQPIAVALQLVRRSLDDRLR